MNDYIVSFFQNIKQKITNPFFATLFFTWCVRHWEALYSLVVFDSQTSRQTRIDILKSYFDPKEGYTPFYEDLFYCILWAFGVLTVSYLLTNSTTAITNFFDYIVRPWIFKLTAKSETVLKTDLEQAIKEKNEANDQLEREREVKQRKIKERDDLEIERSELKRETQKLSKNLQDETKHREECQYQADHFEEQFLIQKKHIQDFNDKVSSLEKENQALKESRRITEYEKTEGSNTIANLKLEIKELKEKSIAYMVKINSLMNEKKTLENILKSKGISSDKSSNFDSADVDDKESREKNYFPVIRFEDPKDEE